MGVMMSVLESDMFEGGLKRRIEMRKTMDKWMNIIHWGLLSKLCPTFNKMLT